MSVTHEGSPEPTFVLMAAIPVLLTLVGLIINKVRAKGALDSWAVAQGFEVLLHRRQWFLTGPFWRSQLFSWLPLLLPLLGIGIGCAVFGWKFLGQFSSLSTSLFLLVWLLPALQFQYIFYRLTVRDRDHAVRSGWLRLER